MVDGSNPSTPTSNSISKSARRAKPLATQPATVHKFVDSFVDKNRVVALLHQLTSLQREHGLSDRALAKTIGVSKSHISYLRRGLRKPASSSAAAAVWHPSSASMPGGK
ncbi:MAG TPA: helix-turn-helix transcriptional regulator [Dehalococcoidales bacterium]|nr:helix-turn-helix transcriptional regulator [Dehalococcoidales bacterium]